MRITPSNDNFFEGELEFSLIAEYFDAAILVYSKGIIKFFRMARFMNRIMILEFRQASESLSNIKISLDQKTESIPVQCIKEKGLIQFQT